MYPTTMLSLASDSCSSSVRKSQERPAQEYTNCALSIVSIGKWEQLNSVPLCYGARCDSSGKFTFTEAGFIIKINLTYINGSLSCSDILPSSFWGCDHSVLGNDNLTTLVTFKNKTRLLPATVSSDSCNPSYNIHEVGLNSKSLSFEPFDIPLAVAVNDNFQIWFSQDYTDCVEENNSSEICVELHALYS